MRMLPNSGLLKICKSFKSFTPFNKMSSLCCAIAAQLSAFLLSSMPMHPKQNLAAANRYGAPLFLRKSHQRFSLPFLRVAMLCFAFALPLCASQCHCTAVHLIASAALLLAKLRLCSASLYLTTLCHCFALPCFAFATPRAAPPSHGQSNSALPLPSCASHRLRESGPSMPCRCSQAFTS